MRKDKSWTRQQYEEYYQKLRRGYSFGYLGTDIDAYVFILKAADYSYQAYNHELSGWISQSRQKRFHAIYWRIVTATGELTF